MNRLRVLREGKYTQAEMAKLLGVGRTTYTKYESGDIRLSAEMLSRLSRILGVSVDTILGMGDNAPQDNAPRDNAPRDDAPGDDAPRDEVPGDRELWEYREALRRDPERRMLFSLVKDASIDEVRQAVAVIDALKRANRHDEHDPE